MLRLSELYVSVQGEGPRVGEKTQFIRFAGCNMRCPGWPCDTQHAIDPAIWRVQSEKLAINELVSKIIDTYVDTGASNLCFTGGEPLMQPQEDLRQVFARLREHVDANWTWEIFTNGSYHIPSWMLSNFHIMMDWKLPGSGESETKLDERLKNAKRLNRDQGIKFVCKDYEDMVEADTLMTGLRRIDDVIAQFWIGAAWGELSEAEVVDYMIEHGLDAKLNVQVHKFVWPAEQRGV